MLIRTGIRHSTREEQHNHWQITFCKSCFDDDTKYVQAIPEDFTHVFSPPQWRSKDLGLDA
jgi:hypothetical protein